MLILDRDKLLANDPDMIEACTRLIASFLHKFISDPQVINDAIQSTMVELIARLRETGDLTPNEMFRLLSNAASNTLRRRLTQLRRKVVEFESQQHTQAYTKGEYANFVEQREELKRIEELLSEHRERDVLMLIAKVQGFTNQEIADRFGVTNAVVRTSASRTRRWLRLELTAEEKRETLIEVARRRKQENESPFRSQEDPDS